MANEGDKRGSKPGQFGQPKHQRCDQAAKVIIRLASYGLPQAELSDFLAFLAEEAFVTDQGYSPDTLQRHYRDELDAGKMPAEEMAMKRLYAMAFMENIPEGVDKNTAYRIASDRLMTLLNIKFGIVPYQSMRLSGPDGGDLFKGMSDEEVEARIKRHEDANRNPAGT